MNWTVIILISVNLILGYFGYLAINQNGRHLRMNRWYLLLFPLVSIALGMMYHSSEGSVMNGFSIELPLVEISSVSPIHENDSSVHWMFFIYAIGLTFSFLHLCSGLWNVRKPRSAEFLHQLGKFRIYLVPDQRHSYSHFNAIYISEFELENVDFILNHELAHAKQGHSLDLILIRIIRVLLWFHPVIYFWESKMKENHEFLADFECVRDSKNIKQYSYALLSSHFGVSIPELSHGFNKKSLLQKRIIQLKTQNTFNMKKVILIPVVLAGAILTMSIQLSTTNEKPSSSQQETARIIPGEDETKPEFVGGMSALINYLQTNIEYPKELANKNIEAKVYVKFVVTSSGQIEKVQVARGSEHEAFNEEAVRVISSMPNWKPGVKDGKNVSTEMTLPIQFALAK